METWYKLEWGDEITEIEVTRTTDKMLFRKRERWGKISEERVLKRSAYVNYFPTKKEAIAYRIDLLEQRVDSSKGALAYNEKILANFKQRYPKGE